MCLIEIRTESEDLEIAADVLNLVSSVSLLQRNQLNARESGERSEKPKRYRTIPVVGIGGTTLPRNSYLQSLKAVRSCSPLLNKLRGRRQVRNRRWYRLDGRTKNPGQAQQWAVNIKFWQFGAS